MNYQQLLHQGVSQLNLDIDEEYLCQYLELLHKWNKTYNLTAIRDIEEMVTKHILDSLAILPFIKGNTLIDVGTGAGLPGIPVAIARPELHVTLLDSNGKKVRFLQHVVRTLKLKNVECVQSRVEDYRKPPGFDTVTSRAFSNLSQMLSWTNHLQAKDGVRLAMKGQIPEDELTQITNPYHIHSLTIPGLDEQRCCVVIEE